MSSGPSCGRASSQKDYPSGQSVSTAQTRSVEADLVAIPVDREGLPVRGFVGLFSGFHDIGAGRCQGVRSELGPGREGQAVEQVVRPGQSAEPGLAHEKVVLELDRVARVVPGHQLELKRACALRGRDDL